MTDANKAAKESARDRAIGEIDEMYTFDDDYGLEEALEAAFDAGYDHAAAELRWIPVSERLPDANDAVPHNDKEIDGGLQEGEVAVLTTLVIGGNWMTAWSHYNIVKKQWENYAGYPIGKGTKVLAWRPLPEPYTEPAALKAELEKYNG